MSRLFGTDGIRGLANQDPITPEMGRKLGRAVVQFCKQRGNSARVVIGRDTRASGKMLDDAIASGVLSMGGEAHHAEELPTPGVAFLTRQLGAGAGIVVSASHNTYEYNGFKIFTNEGFKLSEAEEAEVEDLIFSQKGAVTPGESVQPRVVHDAGQRYVAFLKETFPEDQSLEGLKVVIDCANGATWKVAPAVFHDLGACTEALFVSPDGENINQDCGSQHTESLSSRVLETQAHVGLAFDGDGDRFIAVDEKGHVLTGDQILTICAKLLKQRGELDGNTVVSTVMSNIGFPMALERLGIEHVPTQVGDRWVMEEMRARNASLGGEDSGHIIFLRHHTTGDGIISALQLLSAMKQFRASLSQLSTLMTVFPQILMNVVVRSKPEISSVPSVVEVIERVEQTMGDRGRVLVRYSGTEPVCRVMVEGENYKEAEQYAQQIAGVIERELN